MLTICQTSETNKKMAIHPTLAVRTTRTRQRTPATPCSNQLASKKSVERNPANRGVKICRTVHKHYQAIHNKAIHSCTQRVILHVARKFSSEGQWHSLIQHSFGNIHCLRSSKLFLNGIPILHLLWMHYENYLPLCPISLWTGNNHAKWDLCVQARVYLQPRLSISSHEGPTLSTGPTRPQD